MIHIRNLSVKNKKEIKNFLNTQFIFSSHQLQTGNASSTYDNYGKLFEQFDVFDILSKTISEKVNRSFSDMWANINPPGTFVRPHNHFSADFPNALVGVYYLHKPKNSGNLIIEGNVIDVQENDVIFFNDYDMHWTQENKSSHDRVAISFNMI